MSSGRERVVLLAVLVAAVFARPVLALEVNITLYPSEKRQTMVGWEATAQAGQEASPHWDKYKDDLFDKAVNELGINRLKVGVESRSHGADFDLAKVDRRVDKVALPIKKLLEARGRKLYLNFNVVGSGLQNEPDKYAQNVLATFQHMKAKYGFVPDGWEFALEPITFGWGRPAQLAACIIATGDLLTQKGYDPEWIWPSSMGLGRAIQWFDTIAADHPKALKYFDEYSYHPYRDDTPEKRKAIKQRANKHKVRTSQLEHIGRHFHHLHADIAYGVSAWCQYSLCFPTPSDNGAKYFLIGSPPDHVVMGERTKFLRHYMKFVRRGAVRIKATSDHVNYNALAFINAGGGYVVVIKAASVGNFHIHNLAPGTYGIKYTTGKPMEEPWEYNVDLKDQKVSAGETLSARMPKRGVITVYAKVAASKP